MIYEIIRILMARQIVFVALRFLLFRRVKSVCGPVYLYNIGLEHVCELIGGMLSISGSGEGPRS